jgi:hypothetical protein
LNNTNWDNDAYPNFFEKFISKTNYLTPNNLYLIFFDAITKENETGGCGIKGDARLIIPALLEAGISKNNILWYVGKNATYTNFKFAVNKIASLAKENDTVVISLEGHGWKDRIWFNDGEKLYSDIAKDIEKIKSTQIIFISACYSGGALKYFPNTSKIVILTSTDENRISHGLTFFNPFYNEYSNYTVYKNNKTIVCINREKEYNIIEADKDKNGYISVLEAFEYAKNHCYWENPQIMNAELARNLYLIGTYISCRYDCEDCVNICEKSEI